MTLQMIKQEQKIIAKPSKKKYKNDKRPQEYYINFAEHAKIKKRNYTNNMPEADKEKRKVPYHFE